MMRTIKKEWRYLVIAPLFFTALLTAHVKSYEMFFFSPEVMISYLLLFFAGLIPGLLMVFGSKWLRITTIVSILMFFILTQITTMHHLHKGIVCGLIILLSAIFYALIYYGLSKKLAIDRLLFVFFGIIWLGSFVVTGTPFFSEKLYAHKPGQNTKLPPYIEIILDEHIGIDGAGVVDDKNGVLDSIRRNYIRRGFRVYSKAYSREVSTLASFSSFLNFKSLDRPDDYLSINPSGSNNVITKNAHFKSLTKRGYLINVIQSNYLNFCLNQDNISLGSCITYSYDNRDYTSLFRSLTGKIESILVSIITLSHVDLCLNKLMLYFGIINYQPKMLLIGVSIPRASYSIYLHNMQLAKKIKRGNAYFIHILLINRGCIRNQFFTTRTNRPYGNSTLILSGEQLRLNTERLIINHS